MLYSSVHLLQQLNRKLASGFILAFHEIPADRFVNLVESLGRLEIVPLETLSQRSKAGRSTSGLAAITVDDCVGGNTRALIKLLEAKAWPGTFYVPTSYLDSGEGMPFQWWFRLEPFLSGKILHLKARTIDLTVPNAVKRLFKEMELLWHTRPRETYVSTIAEIGETLVRDYAVPKASLIPPAPLTWPELAAFSRNEMIRFESHGKSHTAMSALSEPDLESELRESKKAISEHTGRECRHLAYPFGSPASIGSVSPTIAARYYESAVTMSLGSVAHANPWLIPRIPLYAQNTARTANFKVLLKCSKAARLGPSVRFHPRPKVDFLSLL
jgi:peptidoglycan/xylan/chitin deacetylase (PgdA/CDA1 family)